MATPKQLLEDILQGELAAGKPPELILSALQQMNSWFTPEGEACQDVVNQPIAAKKPLSAKGFKAFYHAMNGFTMPKDQEQDIEDCFRAHELGVPFLEFGYRGCFKTVTMSEYLDAYLLGHNPEKTGLVVCGNDDSAEKITKAIATMIEFHPIWKLIFPDVVPYKEKGWSIEGYFLRDASKSIEEWSQKQASIIDPSFVGGGWSSSSLNGKHPSLFMNVDDLHDLGNSGSERERKSVRDMFFKQILKTAIRENDKLSTWVNVVGVPYADDDVYHTLKNSGECVFVNKPAMRQAPENAEGAVYLDGVNKNTGVVYDDIKGWWFLTRPDRFGVNSILSERSFGKSAFWQMIMLDIKAASSGSLKYYIYDHTKIQREFVMMGGADPSNIDKTLDGAKGSSFALAILAKLPQGGAVVVDGFLKPCGIVEAKNAILQAQSEYPNLQMTGVENVGGGAVFLQYLWTFSEIRAIDSNLKLDQKTKGIRNKMDRIRSELHPWIENMVIRISNEDTPYLNALRNLFDNFYDLVGSPHNEGWDAADALYHAAKLMPEIMVQPVGNSGELPSIFRKEKSSSILEGMNKSRGYGNG